MKPVEKKSSKDRVGFLNKDRRVILFALGVIYISLILPISMFLNEQVVTPETPTEEPDLFRSLHTDKAESDVPVTSDDELEEEEPEIIITTQKPSRRQGMNETERAALRQWREQKEKAWRMYWDSPVCKTHRSDPPGLASEGRRGIGLRAACLPNSEDRIPVDYQTSGSVDVSLTYRAIYVPLTKAASTSIQDAFVKRFKARRISDRNLPLYVKRAGLKVEDFFVFTFVRDPFSMFQSAYREVSKLTSRNTTAPGTPPFALLDESSTNEPRRAIMALQAAQDGLLKEPHLYTQLWRTQRCYGSNKTMLHFNFIGHMETIDEDWKFVQLKLNVSTRAFPHNWGTLNSKLGGRLSRNPSNKLEFAPVTAYLSPYSSLTKHICDYYRTDFDCFGFDNTLCET